METAKIESVSLTGRSWRISLDLESGRTSLPGAFPSAIHAAGAARIAASERGYSVVGANYGRHAFLLQLALRDGTGRSSQGGRVGP